MHDLIDYAALAAMVKEYFGLFLDSAFSGGLLVGATLEILGYGIFKAVSLLNMRD